MLVSVSRTIMHYKPRVSELNEKIRKRLKELAAKKRRYGHHRLYVLLRREGFMVNHKRTERIYREEKLTLRIRRRKKLKALIRTLLPKPNRPNQYGSVDCVHDKLWSGRRFRSFLVVDTFTRECLAVETDTSLPGLRVRRVLEKLPAMRGLPEAITLDNGPELISKVVDEWAHRNNVKFDFIEPGKPTQNGYIESFNGKFRDECLDENYFLTLFEARQTIEDWRIEYNTERPHSSLDDLTPEEFRRQYLKTQTTPELYSSVA